MKRYPAPGEVLLGCRAVLEDAFTRWYLTYFWVLLSWRLEANLDLASCVRHDGYPSRCLHQVVFGFGSAVQDLSGESYPAPGLRLLGIMDVLRLLEKAILDLVSCFEQEVDELKCSKCRK